MMNPVRAELAEDRAPARPEVSKGRAEVSKPSAHPPFPFGLSLSKPTLCIALAFATTLAHAAPFTPPTDTTVVEQLPTRLSATERQLRTQLRQQPAHLPLALHLAHEALARARRSGDPRELGQAQAALAPWWALPEPPAAVRLLRATVWQSQHQFARALVELDALLQTHTPLPLQAQAELTRAAVLQVQGRWREAEAACERLAGPRYAALGEAVRAPAQACRIELAQLQGRAPEADRQLAQLATQAGEQAGWITLLRAELAERSGHPRTEALYRQAIAAQPEVYPLAALADWLLAQARPAEAALLLDGRPDADALLLRQAIAWKRSADPRAAQAAATLAARFSAAGQRGEASAHAREQARFALDVQGDAPAALRHAQHNWAMQKEPADALLLLRAADAAGQPGAAEPVRQFIRETGWVDARLPRSPRQKLT